jgi:hypothetical protein
LLPALGPLDRRAAIDVEAFGRSARDVPPLWFDHALPHVTEFDLAIVPSCENHNADSLYDSLGDSFRFKSGGKVSSRTDRYSPPTATATLAGHFSQSDNV